MKMTYKVAFIGAGYMTSEHIKAFKDIPQVELCGITSRTRARAEALAEATGVSQVCDSIEALYAATKADLVVIAVPELSVKDVCIEAFKYPWTCLIEKPAGYNVADAEHILATAKEQKRDAFLALNRRHHSSTRAIVKDLENFDGQRLVHVYDQENPRVALESGQPQEVVDHWMYANSIHVIDYFKLFCRGELLSVENLSEWKPGEPCFVLSKLSYSSGDIGMYEAVWEGPGPWAATVITHSRRWEMRPLEQASFQNYQSRQIETVPVHSWDTQFKPGLRLQAEEAIRALSGKSHRLPSLEEGLQTMNIVRKIYGT
jgi:predicted dehydrogenase